MKHLKILTKKNKLKNGKSVPIYAYEGDCWWDQCSNTDAIHCGGGAHDVCDNDWAACYESWDKCDTNDYAACTGSGTQDLCPNNDWASCHDDWTYDYCSSGDITSCFGGEQDVT